MNPNSPKHKLAMVGFALSVISVLFSIIVLSISTKTRYSENQASLLLGLAVYTGVPGIICSVIAKLKKNTEIFSTIGIVAGIVAVVLIFATISAGL